MLTPFLRPLVERGLDGSQGLLVIVDGGKGLRGGRAESLPPPRPGATVAVAQRENVVSYLAKSEQPVWRQRLQRAYNRPEYDEALAALQSLQHELEERNQSAAGSLAEGLDETLTLHRLGVYGVLGRSLKTTNGLESINALIEERCAKVDHWQNSSQRHRWLATALLDIEPRLRKVMGYRHLPKLRDAMKRALKIDTTSSTKKAAEAIRSRGEFQLGMGLTHGRPTSLHSLHHKTSMTRSVNGSVRIASRLSEPSGPAAVSIAANARPNTASAWAGSGASAINCCYPALISF